MTKILRIDSSPRPISPDNSAAENSFSRSFPDHIIAQLVRENPASTIIERDLNVEPIRHITNDTLKGYHTPTKAMTASLRQATARSDALIDELQSADLVVLPAPIYNFSAPPALKTLIDQIIRPGHPLQCDEAKFLGLLSDCPTYLARIGGAAGYASGRPLESYNYLRPYLSDLMNFIGLSIIAVFSVEATTAPDASEYIRAAKADVDARLQRAAAG